MKDETMGQEDAAQDAEACAEALESLDQIALAEIAFDDSSVDVRDEPEIEAQPDDQDAKDDGAAPTEDETGHEESECEADDQPESDTSEKTILLDSLPAEDSLTRELPGLGSTPAVDETIAMGDIPLPSVPSAREAEVRHRKMPPKRRNLMVAGVVAVALVAGGAGYAAWNGYRQEQAAITAANAHTMMSVQIGVHAAGLDCSTGSKIPVQVSGQDSDGSSVSETLYVDEHGRGIKLLPGDYTLSIAASPIAADGTVYAVPAEKLSIKLDEKAAEKKIVDAGDVALESVEASEVTDDQIAAAKKYAEEDEGAKEAGFDIDAEALSTAATKRRDDAVAAKQAEDEARRQAEEAARKAEEARQARTFETDYFTMVLPDWFPMDWLEFETTSDTLTANDVRAQDVASKANFTVYATDGSPRSAETAFSKTIGKTSSGKTVVLSGGPYWGYVQDGYRPLGINYDFTGETYCDLLASCITLK